MPELQVSDTIQEALIDAKIRCSLCSEVRARRGLGARPALQVRHVAFPGRPVQGAPQDRVWREHRQVRMGRVPLSERRHRQLANGVRRPNGAFPPFRGAHREGRDLSDRFGCCRMN